MFFEVDPGEPLRKGDILIYALSDPLSGAIRYVGSTLLPAACLKRHLSLKRNRDAAGLKDWIAGLVATDLRPKMLELAIESGDFRRLCAHEKYWIERLTEMGEQLFNA